MSRDDPPPPSIGVNEDLLMQVYEPARLARELLDDGVTAMKIWPFDVFALRNNGAEISAAELRKALWPLEQVRSEVGDAVDIMVEYHGLWQLPAALKIAELLEEFGVYWHEEPVWMQNFDDVARFRDKVESAGRRQRELRDPTLVSRDVCSRRCRCRQFRYRLGWRPD